MNNLCPDSKNDNVLMLFLLLTLFSKGGKDDSLMLLMVLMLFGM